jgi:hypothetical protein
MMKQANRGILKVASRDKFPEFIRSKKLIVLVRPFDFDSSTHDIYPYGQYVPGVMSGEGYLDALETSLYTDYHGGDLFVFDHESQFESTEEGLEEIGALDGGHNVYFVPVSPGDTPLEGRSPVCFSRVSKFLKNLSNQRAGFAGGPIMPEKRKLRRKYSGCLGDVFEGLKREGIRGRLLRGVCFTNRFGEA